MRKAVDGNFGWGGFRVHRTDDMGPITKDGEQYLIEVWDLEVGTLDGFQWVYELSFKSEEEAIAFGQVVQSYGSINPDKWCCSFDPDHANDLPDYVLDPTNPKFN